MDHPKHLDALAEHPAGTYDLVQLADCKRMSMRLLFMDNETCQRPRG